MPRPSPLPLQLGPAFTVPQARAAGVSESRLRRDDVDAPHRGVRMLRPSRGHAPAEALSPRERDRAAQAELLERARAYALIMDPDAFFTGRTALGIHGLPHAFDAGAAELSVGVLDPARAPRARGIRGSKSIPSLVTITHEHGLRVADPASAWAALAGELSVRDLIRVGDAIVRIPRDQRGRPCPEARLGSRGDLERVTGLPYRRRRWILEDAMALIRVGSMSPLETDFRLLTVDAGLPEPQLDVEIRDPGGTLLKISDAVYRAERIAIEVEGDHHRTNRAQWSSDIDKHAALAAHGWEVLRLTSTHIRRERDTTVRRLADALARRAPR